MDLSIENDLSGSATTNTARVQIDKDADFSNYSVYSVTDDLERDLNMLKTNIDNSVADLHRLIDSNRELAHYEVENEDQMWRTEVEALNKKIAYMELVEANRQISMRRLRRKLIAIAIVEGLILIGRVLIILAGFGII